jgi:pimeloyl-ACP methyl ester carboxylesterase
MRAYTVTIPAASGSVRELLALVVESDSVSAATPVLLFLHGKGEAGSSLSALPLVCVHQTPPFQALLGHFPGALVISPQAPPVPDIDAWNWREYVNGLVEFLTDRYGDRRIVATGFSRGGLGVLQLVSAYPDLVQAWAVVDPQPARDQKETNTILSEPTLGAKGWLRYGLYRDRDEAWKEFSALLFAKFPDENRDLADLPHDQMAVQAYCGNPLSAGADKKNLYEFLGLKFQTAHPD